MSRATPPAALSPGKKRYPLYRRLGVLQGQAGIKEYVYLAFAEDPTQHGSNMWAGSVQSLL